jgi:Na+-translocating ferredoxin:NAD+ oxidoreductase RnfG subunit
MMKKHLVIIRNYKIKKKFNDVRFNIEIKSEDGRDQGCVDVIVDKHQNGQDLVVIVMQYVKTPGILHKIIGVLTIEVKTDKRLFVIDQSETKNYESQVELYLLLFHKKTLKITRN